MSGSMMCCFYLDMQPGGEELTTEKKKLQIITAWFTMIHIITDNSQKIHPNSSSKSPQTLIDQVYRDKTYLRIDHMLSH